MVENSSNTQCDECSQTYEAGAMFCPECNAIQPFVSADYFSIFGLKTHFDVDVAAIEKTYFALQKQLHPDRFTSASILARTYSLQHSVTVNDAYATLKNPLKRAEYLLNKQGISVNQEQNSIKPDPDVLMETMELREALAEIDTSEAVRVFSCQLADTRKDILRQLHEALSQEKWQQAGQLAIRLRYVEKTQEETKRKKQQLRESYAAA